MIISKFIQTNNCFILFGDMNLDSCVPKSKFIWKSMEIKNETKDDKIK